jgi:hypothetical protein
VTTVLLVVVRIAILAVVATRRSGYSAHSRLALGIEVDLVHGGGRVAQHGIVAKLTGRCSSDGETPMAMRGFAAVAWWAGGDVVVSV